MDPSINRLVCDIHLIIESNVLMHLLNMYLTQSVFLNFQTVKRQYFDQKQACIQPVKQKLKPVFQTISTALGLYLESESSSKTFSEPTYVVNQLWSWKYSLIFLLLLRPNLGPFLPFLGLWGLFLGLRSGSKTFLGPTYID